MVNDKQLTDLLQRCNYKYKDLSKRDIKQALESFNELSCSCENYVFPNGSFKDLVSLNGTIPVNIKNQRYNIPVQVYLSDTHPYQAPICYVRPTPDMSINPRCKVVDLNGRVSLPCLTDWKYPPSDIYFLLNMMSIQFSEETPLFAKSAPAARPTSSSSMNNISPYPGAYPSNTATATANPTPYPNSSSSSQPPYPSSSTSSSSAATPVYPPYPASNNTNQPPPYPSTASATVNPYYPFGMPMPSYVNTTNNNFGQTRPTLNNTPLSSSSGVGSSSSYADETIKPEYYKMSLVSAVIDKYRFRLNEQRESKQAEIESLQRVKNDLQVSERQLNTFIAEGQSELLSIAEMTQELKKKTSQLSENVNKIQHRDKANIEDAVVTTTPLYRQLMQSYAEEMAIQDLIYFLSEGLMHKSITLDSFLKQVRMLSRKQFILRATMQRAREKASLPI